MREARSSARIVEPARGATPGMPRGEGGRPTREELHTEVHRQVLARGGKAHGNGEWRFRCPEEAKHRNGDAHPSADWNPEKDGGVWICRVCGAHGGVSDLARRLGIRLSGRSRVGATADLHAFARERRLPMATLHAFGVRGSQLRNRPALRFPTVLGIDRLKYTDGGHPKYAWTRSGGRAHCYGLALAVGLLRPGSLLYIVNGEPSVWAAYTAGLPAVCFCAGEVTAPPPLVTELVTKLRAEGVNSVRIVYDLDEAGRTGALKLRQVLQATGLDVIALDLSPALAELAGGDLDDLHRRVGADLPAILSTLPALVDSGGGELSLPSSNSDDRACPDSRGWPDGPDASGCPASSTTPDGTAASVSSSSPASTASSTGPAGPDGTDASDGTRGELPLPGRLIETAHTLAEDLRRRSTFDARRLPFTVARALRGIDPSADLPTTYPASLQEAVSEFWRVLQLPSPPPWLAAMSDFAQDDGLFYTVAAAWEKVRSPGRDALAVAFRQALASPIVLSLSAPGPRFGRLTSTAYYLQKFRGDLPIQLPVERLGTLLDCSPRHVSTLLGYACRHAIIITVDHKWSLVHRKAKSYRFNLASKSYVAPDLVNGPCRGCGEQSWYRDGIGTFICPPASGCGSGIAGLVQSSERIP